MYDFNGAVRSTFKILLDIADKEGAHIISTKGKPGIAFVPKPGNEPPTLEQAAAANYEANWQQFVISAGVRLLYAMQLVDGEFQRMFPSSLDALPVGDDDSEVVRLQRTVDSAPQFKNRRVQDGEGC
ncbi:MAG: hypothetical protein OXL97_11770 [Chloroflexota bacterium]|nr:hypothetical protein [Chloroflexota bacterium]MDE2884644.1 hypothetical protein [Chloroflexota bacterium]